MRRPGWQRTTLIVVAFLLLSQTAQYVPGAALDVLVLVLLGWRWSPLVFIAGVLHALLFAPGTEPLHEVFLREAATAIVYGAATWYTIDRLRVHFPLRNVRDVAIFCGILTIGAPIAVAYAEAGIRAAFGVSTTTDVLATSAVIALVPSVLAFMTWSELRTSGDHRDPPLAELIACVAGTALFVLGGATVAYVANAPLLDLSFVAIGWLAMRYGIRGAALGISTIYIMGLLVPVVVGARHGVDPSAIVAYQGFLMASSLMALLLGGSSMERSQLVARLANRAYVDELTGLPNRIRLVKWIESHNDAAVVLVILDIDDMRLLNQGVGRSAVDRVLQDMATRLRASFPASHFIARVSADEFAVCVVDERSPHALMSELRSFFETPFEVDESRIYVSTSMGAVRAVRASCADEMLRKADLALDRAKSSPSRSVVYAPELQNGSTPSLVGELHQAVVRRQLEPFYQPIFRYDREGHAWRLVGAEALLRWIHPERGIIAPASFIDMLERLSIGEHVGWDVVERALLQAAQWRTEIPGFRVWVNFFPRQVLQRNCAERIAEILERTAVPADALLVEISERVVASDEQDVSALVQQLRDMGVHTAIDDFGTGGSSLGRVRDVPAGVLKIDRSFVARSEVDHKAKAVASTVVRLAGELGMTVVAEGCENAMQLQVMTDMGCDYAQGYALGHPLPADLFARTFLRLESASGF